MSLRLASTLQVPGLLQIQIAFQIAKDLVIDASLLVVRVNGRPVHHPFRAKFGAAIQLLGSLIRSIHPKAERPPLPDANLANIGGAIIPALGKRWRAPRKSQ